ncbi:hypothetical protein [Streptomyces pinistramenti]|uniref:hypothetical protein n=1 Tax=Streptomyces pinistramenti TaxID=2884812 RepID=UPI001D076ADC|nr:hypothetical protein [Streptomyces pinistramenti]MCB5909761.1 hypothetical protein [Streptomyces pinistramenti]
MSLHDDLTALERSLGELVRAVGRLEKQVGGGLDIRRVRSDADHLGESLRLLKESVASSGRTAGRPATGDEGVVTISDAPYDSTLWTDAEDEGLGAKDRHAP